MDAAAPLPPALSGSRSSQSRLAVLEAAQVRRRARLQALARRTQYLQLRVAEQQLEREQQALVSPVPSAAELLRASSAPQLETIDGGSGDEQSSDEGDELQEFAARPLSAGDLTPPPVRRSRAKTASVRWRGSLHAGWLWKEGDGLFSSGDFKRRYFVLEQTIVRYYQEQPTLQPGQTHVALRTTSGNELAKGMFDVHGAVIGQPKNPRKGFPHCLRIDLQKRDRSMRRKYILAADTNEQIVMWAAKLNAASAGLLVAEQLAEDAPDTSIAGTYDVIKRCAIRAGCELESAECGLLEVGQAVQVFESRILTTANSTQTRARVSGGWVSIVSASGELLLRRRSQGTEVDEVVEAVPPERAASQQEREQEREQEPEPEPEPELDSDSSLWTESLSSLLSRPWTPGTDQIRKRGMLRIVEEEVGWMAAFSDRAERRDRRASVTASTVAPPYICELNGLHFRWMTPDDNPTAVGMVSLDVGSINQLNVDKSMARVIAIPGYYLCAETHADAVDWLMSMVFNCQTAIYAQRYARERHLAPPDADEIPSVDALLLERANGGLAAEKFSPRTVRHARHDSERVLLGIELYRGPPQLRQTEPDQAAYAALDGSSEVQVDLQFWQERGHASNWRTVHHTEAQAPSRISSATAPEETVDMRAISFCVMISFEVPKTVARAGHHKTQLSQRVRLVVRRPTGETIGEPFTSTLDELVQSERPYFVHRIDFATPLPHSPPVKQAWPPQDRYGNQTGAHLGIHVYRRDDRPTRTFGFTDAVSQSYLVPVERCPPEDGPDTVDAMAALSAERHRDGQKLFFDGPVVGLDSPVPACIVTEHLQIPRTVLDVPVCFLTHRIQQLRSEILASLDATKMAASLSGPARLLTAEEELLQYGRVCRLQQQMQKVLMLLPWYSSSLRFYEGLVRRSEHGREAFLKTSTLKKDRDWAFVATNLCHQSITVDRVPANATPTAYLPLFSGITCGVQAAHCEGFDLLGESGVGLLHMHRQCEQHTRLLAAAQQQSAYNLRPISSPTATNRVRPRMQTQMEDAVLPELRISKIVDQLENRIQSRTDVVLCQLLSTVAAAFMAIFQASQWSAPPSQTDSDTTGSLATGPLRALRTLERTGVFYIQFESLLSTRKNEKGMIEDLWHVIEHCMPDVQLRCTRAQEDRCLGIEACDVGSSTAMCINLGLSEETFAMLPPRLVEPDGTRSVRIRILAVLFSQGINEQQSLAHHMGEGALEDRINQRSLRTLKQFFNELTLPNVMSESGDGTSLQPNSIPTEAFEEATRTSPGTVIGPMSPEEEKTLRASLARVHRAVQQADGDENKHPEVLLAAEQFSALIGGARVTSCDSFSVPTIHTPCKSGKDRTGMAVTLEEWNSLNLWFEKSGLRIAYGCGQTNAHLRDLLRSEGVRRDNVRLNTGKDNYAFNSFQQSFLPEMYRPPAGTYGANVT